MKRGGIKLDFFQEYGWAVFVIIASIIMIVYYGVFSPAKYLPSGCVIDDDIGCVRYGSTENGVMLALKNKQKSDLMVTDLVLSGRGISGCYLENDDLKITGNAEKEFFLVCDKFPHERFN